MDIWKYYDTTHKKHLVCNPMNKDKLEGLGLDFDEECKDVVGISFYEWIKNRSVNYVVLFNFCKKVYEDIGISQVFFC